MTQKAHPKRWTTEKIIAVASECASRTQFIKRAPAAYVAARRLGIIDDVCSHMVLMRQPSGYWTIERLRAAALCYETRGQFRRQARNPYEAARRRGLLDAICGHMRRAEIDGFYRKELYLIRKLGSRVGYVGITGDVATRYAGHLKANTPHMAPVLSSKHRLFVLAAGLHPNKAADLEDRLIRFLRARGWTLTNRQAGGNLGPHARKWTPLAIKIEAQKYQSRLAFARGSESAYRAARKLRILDKVCVHMGERLGPRYVAERQKHQILQRFMLFGPRSVTET